VFAVFSKTLVAFRPEERRQRMPVILAFFLIGVAVWLAEDVCTCLAAWQHPHQTDGWEAVDAGEPSSWRLRDVVSFILPAALKACGGRCGSFEPASAP
jgi:uncharacterized membrane protein YoaT (DUF817 family)